MTRHLPTEERRAQILDAARRCFLERGYQGTRVEDIADAAGLSKGAVYFHFESKRVLLDALVEDEFERAGHILDAAASDTSPDPFAAMAMAYLSFLGEPQDGRHRFFLLTGELAVHDEALRERLLTHHRALVARLADVLSRWSARGGLALPDPDATAVLLKAMADGLQGAWGLGHALDRGRLAAAALHLLLNGLRGNR
jgi:TetR/AcrR family acrAB operon transcriptional repressor